MKEGLIKLLLFLRFNRACLKPRKNYAVIGFSIDKEISSVCSEGNMHWKLKQRKYMAVEKKHGKGFRG